MSEKRVINLHLTTSEHAWLKGFAKFENVTMTQILRDHVRESMRRELALAGIEAKIRCAWAWCYAQPAGEGGECPLLCAAHGAMAAQAIEDDKAKAAPKRRRSRKEAP